jgi:SAM-dependent methyltransferase
MRSATAEDILPEPVTPDFDRLAHVYRWMEWLSFGPFLSRCRCAFLQSLENCRSALILGDGDGRFTARLLDENPHISIDAVDVSAAMIGELRRRAGSNARLQVHISDARVFKPLRRDYHLVVTHFFLDCLTTEEVELLARRLRNHAHRNAVWVVSEFSVPPGWYGRAIAQPLINVLYWAFGWLTGLRVRSLPHHRFALAQAGWSLERERRSLGGLLVSELWQYSPHP